MMTTTTTQLISQQQQLQLSAEAILNQQQQISSVCICTAKIIKYKLIIKKYEMFCRMLFLKNILKEKFNDAKTINMQIDYNKNATTDKVILQRVLFFGEIDFINAKKMRNYYYIQTIKEIFSILAYEEEQELVTKIRFTPYHKSKFNYSCYSYYIKYRILFGTFNKSLFNRSPNYSIYMQIYIDCVREIKLMQSIILILHCNCKYNKNNKNDNEERFTLSLYDLITKSKLCEQLNSCLAGITKFSIPLNIFNKFYIYKTCVNMYCYIESDC